MYHRCANIALRMEVGCSRQQLALPREQFLLVLLPPAGQRDEQRAAGNERGVEPQFRRPLIAAVFECVEAAFLRFV